MAQHKVPQDVEADDKLLGPFTFRQFVYLLITVGSAALAVALFQIFPVLAILPVPFILFFGILAVPLKRDQPMETYIAAIVAYYLKPHRRVWMPGQREATIIITTPKKVEQPRTRNLSEEEAARRLSFLAGIVDSEGFAIHNSTIDAPSSNIQEEIVAEANTAHDMLDANASADIDHIIERRQADHRHQVLSQMHTAIENADAVLTPENPPIPPATAPGAAPTPDAATTQNPLAPETSETTSTTSQAEPTPESTNTPTPSEPLAPTTQSTPETPTTPEPPAPPSRHSRQLAEMRQVIAQTEAAHGTAAPISIDHNHIDYNPSERPASPDYAAAMDALLHPENHPTPDNPTPDENSSAQPSIIAQNPAFVNPNLAQNQNLNPAQSQNPAQNPTPNPATNQAQNPAPPPTPTLQTSPEPNLSAEPTPTPPPARTVPSARFVNLASNQDYTVETIQKEANRIKQAEEEQEVFISLH